MDWFLYDKNSVMKELKGLSLFRKQAEAYSKACQKSKIQYIANIVDG